MFHDDVRHERFAAVGLTYDLFAGIENAHDGGMRHARCGLRFVAEPAAEHGVGGQRRLQQFDGDAAAKLGIGREVHVGHATATDQRAELVACGEQSGALCNLVHRCLGFFNAVLCCAVPCCDAVIVSLGRRARRDSKR